MNHGWGRHVGDPPSFQQRLGIRDCDSAIGELVLRGDVARLFAPSIWPFAYNATLEFQDGRRVVVRVFKAAGGGRETRLGDGWREICEDYDLMPGDVAVFTKAEEHGTFFAGFIDADGNDKLRRLDEADPPSSPEFLFDDEPDPPLSPEFLFDAPDSPSSPEFQVVADSISQLIEISRQRLEFQKKVHEENKNLAEKNLAEKAVMDKSWKVTEVTKIAEQQMGITPDQVELWDGLYWLTKNEPDMDFFLASTSEAERKRIIVMNIPRKAG